MNRRSLSRVRQRRRIFREGPKSVLDFERFIGFEAGEGIEFHVEPPGKDHYHVLTPDEVRARIALLPQRFLKNLRTIVMPRMTRKRQRLGVYGLQWDTSIYLYPMNDDLFYDMGGPVPPLYRIDALKYGGKILEGANEHGVQWDEDSIHNYYLENILIHEIGHTFDTKNTRDADREAYAEDFVNKWGNRGLK